jgi:hypothetical protein
MFAALHKGESERGEQRKHVTFEEFQKLQSFVHIDRAVAETESKWRHQPFDNTVLRNV